MATALRGAYIDINALVVVAVVGAVADGEYLDACLVVTLFCAGALSHMR